MSEREIAKFRYRQVLISFALLVALLMIGFYMGLQSYVTRSGLYSYAEDLMNKVMAHILSSDVFTAIMSLNSFVYATSIVPFVGPFLLGLAVFDAGVVLGFAAAMICEVFNLDLTYAPLLVLVQPHVVPELLGFSHGLALSLYLSAFIVKRRWRTHRLDKKMLLIVALSGLGLLALAALVETALIQAIRTATVLMTGLLTEY
jgi:uncharacterized membrane protein SpoIIM required for sporulation